MSGTKKKLKLDQNQIIQPKQHPQPFNLAFQKQQISIQIVESNPQSLQFDIQGIDASFANALRRIMISEVPTMAFHKVLLYQNTSVLPDQLLVHRLGLLPLNISCQNFQERKDDEELNEMNSLKFKIQAVCRRKQQYRNMSQEEIEEKKLKPEEYLENSSIYSKDIEWVPMGKQKGKFVNPGPVHPNILLAKLRQNQEINLIIYAEKGIGKRHSKWSPVSTAFYRLMPSVRILESFQHQKNAQGLVSACPGNVFIEKKGKAVVKDARACTSCRECLKLQGVEVEKIIDHFLFTIESVGMLSPEQIFGKALDILEEKAKSYEL